LIVGRHW